MKRHWFRVVAVGDGCARRVIRRGFLCGVFLCLQWWFWVICETRVDAKIDDMVVDIKYI